MDGTFVDCEADDYQGHGLELEVYRFDYESRYWMGPFYYWSDLYQTGSSSDLKARNQIIMNSICINYYMTFLKKVDYIFKFGIPLSSLLLVRVLERQYEIVLLV